MSSATKVEYPNITVKLIGEDGNIFSIMGRVREALIDGGASDAEIKAFLLEVVGCDSYDEALRTVVRWVNVE
jgi:hypothetical protein